ncbi:MAG TPA: hypothetical protein VKG21_19365 [Casimicrobiaceae bacterium]|nr:hypothetical protein [Casimicrobiaceae bacterium]
MKALYRIALLVGILATPAVVGATSYSVDRSDLWWVSTESGWGIQLVQRNDAMFATLFVYGSTTAPVWYSATLVPTGPSSWSGDLVATTGPGFATTPFDPATVTRTVVGSMSFVVTSDQTGTLSYTVNGVAVNKQIARQTLKDDDYSGSYAGLIHQVAQGCPDPGDLGVTDNRIDFDIVQSGQTLSIQSQQQGPFPVCQSSGAFTTSGQFGFSQQVINSCTDGSSTGNVMQLLRINVTPSGVMIDFTAPSTNTGSKGCNFTGSIFGIRH